MSRGRFVLFTAIIALAACKEATIRHLSPDAMAPVLADLHIADAYSSMLRDTLHPAIGKNYDSLALWTKSILTKHHTTQKEFSESMDWYRDRPQDLDSLYAKVIPILERSKK